MFWIRFLLERADAEASWLRTTLFSLTWILVYILATIGLSEGLPIVYSMAFGWLFLIIPWILVQLFFNTNGPETLAVGFFWFLGTHVLPWAIFVAIDTYVDCVGIVCTW